MDEAEISKIVDTLRGTFRTGRTFPLQWRKNQLKNLIRMLKEREEIFLDALQMDLGRPSVEGFAGEVGQSMAEADHALKNLSSWARDERIPTPLAMQPGKCRIVREPLGVVLIIGPWNYPLSLMLTPLVGALAAGNCAVLKPSELTPHASAALAEWIPRYFDDGAVRVVEGGIEVASGLLKQRFDHIFYTGNGTVGRIVMEAAAKHLTPVTLELGGKSPCIIDDDVDLNVAAHRIVWGKFFNAGQTCVAPDYLLVSEKIEDALLGRLQAVITEFYGSNPRLSPDFGRIVNDRHHARLTSLLDGGDIVIGGQHDIDGRYVAPTILRNVQLDHPLMKDEIFGPLLPVISVRSMEEAIDFVNDRPKPLALYIFSNNRSHVDKVLTRTSSGGACVNDAITHLSVPELPFGGVGASGMGAYHGRSSFETFSHRKSILDKATWVDPSLRYPPYDDTKLRMLKHLL